MRKESPSTGVPRPWILASLPLLLAACATASPPAPQVAEPAAAAEIPAKEEPGVVVRLGKHEGAVWVVAPCPDGSHVLTGGQDGTLRLWNSATGVEERVLLRGANPICAVGFESKGARFAVAGEGGTVTILDNESWEVTQALACPENAVSGLIFMGKTLLLVFADGTTGGLNLETGTFTIVPRERPWPSPRTFASTIAEGPRWYVKTFAAGEASGRIRFDNHSDVAGLVTVGVRAIDAAHAGAVTALARFPDADLFVSAGADGAIRLWNLKDLKMVAEIPGPAAGVTDLALTEDCRVLWVSRVDGTVTALDVAVLGVPGKAE